MRSCIEIGQHHGWSRRQTFVTKKASNGAEMKCKRCEQPVRRGRRFEYCAFCLEEIVREWEGWQEEIDNADVATIEKLTAINSGLRRVLDRLTNFSPTAAQVNALPDRLRDYVHRLETACDPSGLQAALMHARANIEALMKLNQELRKELGELHSQ